jgi:hypothetical protein
VHQVKLVHHAVPFQQIEGAIHGAAVDGGIQALRLAQDLAGVQVLLRRLDHAQDGAPLFGHADAAGGKFGLQAAGNFSLRKRHGSPSRD